METADQYAAVVEQQLVDARELLDHPTVDAYGADAHDRHAAGAMYLADYAVEAALKHYLIRRYSYLRAWPPGVAPTLDDIRRLGVRLPTNLHSVWALWQATGLEGKDAAMARNAVVCSSWRPAWRYRPPAGKAHEDAEGFYRAAHELARWVLVQATGEQDDDADRPVR